mgnify:CR=1 FL=1
MLRKIRRKRSFTGLQRSRNISLTKYLLAVQLSLLQEILPMPSAPKIIPISDLRQNASAVVKSVASTREPVFITQHGRAAAVMVSMEVYKNAQHEMNILHLLAQGEKEIAAGIGHEPDDVLKEADCYLEAPKP